MRRQRAALTLVAWTFLVWTTRIANVWRDDDLSTGEQWGRTLLALSFTVLALAVLVALWRRVSPAVVVTVGALAAWTTGVWLVRGGGILVGDHDAGFKVVHAVLAVVSIALAALAWREARRPAAGHPSTTAPAAPTTAGAVARRG